MGERFHPNDVDGAMEGDGDDATGTDIGMGALHILAIEADATFSHNLLRKRAGFGEPGEEEKFIEPHKLLSL